MNKKQNYFYCRHCNKKYKDLFMAELCFNIDMKNLTKKESKLLTKKTTKKMKHAKLLKKLGNAQIAFDAEIYDGDYMDTKVTINGIVICWIAGNTITEFHQELENIIEKYRI